MYDNNFLGKNNFIWFNGVVEDRNDPQKLGRLRVRCVGIHTDNKDDLPTPIYVVATHSSYYIIWHFWSWHSQVLLLKAHGCLVTLEMVTQCKAMVIGTLLANLLSWRKLLKVLWTLTVFIPKYKDEVD